VIVAVVIVNLAVLIVGFSYVQSEINSLKPQTPNPTPTVTQPNYTSTVTPSNNTPTSTSTPKPLPYIYTVFGWTLKPECINNAEWFNSITHYNTSQTWKENYLRIISGNGGRAYPAQLRDSTAAYMAVVPAFVNLEFNQETGFTKVTYTYFEQDGVPYLYTIETAYPTLKDYTTGWTQTFVK
jgi:hypothetical protein